MQITLTMNVGADEYNADPSGWQAHMTSRLAAQFAQYDATLASEAVQVDVVAGDDGTVSLTAHTVEQVQATAALPAGMPQPTADVVPAPDADAPPQLAAKKKPSRRRVAREQT